jgi:S1-C subfamily serine protease
MFRSKRLLPVFALSASLGTFALAAEKPADPSKPAKPPAAKAADPIGASAGKLYDKVSPSFVAVKYTWDFELRRQELIGPGVVVSDDGLIMVPLAIFDPIVPDAQMKDFKIVVPSQEHEPDEVDAIFVGRDERTNLAFLKPAPAKKDAKEEKVDKDKDKDKEKDSKNDEPKPQKSSKPATQHKWQPIKLEDRPAKVGQRVWSVGVLPEGAAYKTYLMEGRVSAVLRGEVPQVLVSGALTASGSIVFDDDGHAIGYVPAQGGSPVFLNKDGSGMQAITNPPRIYTPASDLLQSLQDPPVAGKPMQLPWIGVPGSSMTGLAKDVAEVYGLEDQPAVQVGDVIPDAPAAKAGLKKGDVIVKVNGKALERGDETDEVPVILRRKLLRMKVGDEIALSVVRKPGQEPQEIKVKLEPAPKMANLAKRAYFEDLGFGVREMVFNDTYARHLPADSKGVIVSLTKQQGAAQSGGLRGEGRRNPGDVIISLNGQAVENVEGFEKQYKETRKDKPRDAVVLVVRREGREDTVRIEPPQ